MGLRHSVSDEDDGIGFGDVNAAVDERPCAEIASLSRLLIANASCQSSVAVDDFLRPWLTDGRSHRVARCGSLHLPDSNAIP